MSDAIPDDDSPTPPNSLEADGDAVAPSAPDDAESEAAASDLADPVDEQQGLRHAVETLTAAVDRLGERARGDQEIISRMQARIEALQGDQVSALLGPVVTELANLHADFAVAAGRDYDRLGLDRARKEFDILGDRVLSALDVLGAESLDASVGDEFDSRIHSAVRQVATTDPALDRTVATVVRQGFSLDPAAKPLLYARVAVYAYDEAAEPDVAADDAAEPPVTQVAPDNEFRLPFESD